MENQVKVTLIRSTIGALPKQKATVAALGLKKINQSKVFTDSATLQGQIKVVSHMVKVEKI
ncbi:MAG: 50S ribosomal protein L30 [Candidatus Borkfalkiaceae bacterium]|nr:50S ribosomal protein L30 [Christensenellaceae bacterium]